MNSVNVPFMLGDTGGSYLGSDVSAYNFIDVANNNYGLQSGSPAINAGVSIPGFNDGALGGPDVGAFEFGDESGANWPRPRSLVLPITGCVVQAE